MSEHQTREFHFHHHIHIDPELVCRIEHALGQIVNNLERKIMATLQEIQTAAQAQADAGAATAIELGTVATELGALAQAITDLKNNPPAGGIDPVALDPIVAQMTDSTSKLQAAAAALQSAADSAKQVLGA